MRKAKSFFNLWSDLNESQFYPKTLELSLQTCEKLFQKAFMAIKSYSNKSENRLFQFPNEENLKTTSAHKDRIHTYPKKSQTKEKFSLILRKFLSVSKNFILKK